MKIKMKRVDISKWGWAYFMIAPTMIGLFILNIWPIIQTTYLSFCSSGDFGNYIWMGPANYARMATDITLGQATLNTFLFTILSIPAGVCLSLLAAQLLNSYIGGRAIYRTIYFLPVVSAPAAIAMVWKWLYNRHFGLINYILSFLGIEGPGWTTDPSYALVSIAIVSIWSSIGYNMIILLAGLQNIPKSYYQAADIDGAGRFRKYFSITLPLL
jgi:multiple sugar transport system permease protein